MRFICAASAVTVLACGNAALACEGQKGTIIFEDKFADDTGGWDFGSNTSLQSKPPVAEDVLPASQTGYVWAHLNNTFSALDGDYCVEASFPTDAVKHEAYLSLLFWGSDYSNYFTVLLSYDGEIDLSKLANNQWTNIWAVKKPELVKTDPNAVNVIRAAVKGGKITVFVNNQEIKSVRAQEPKSELKFGFRSYYAKPSDAPVTFVVHSYTVTSGE